MGYTHNVIILGYPRLLSAFVHAFFLKRARRSKVLRLTTNSKLLLKQQLEILCYARTLPASSHALFLNTKQVYHHQYQAY